MNNDEILRDILDSGLQQCHLNSVGDSLWQYLLLLKKWNTAYNLTAVRKPEEMISKHLLDSLAVIPWLKGTRILDVGTGAGLPGVPLAIAQPDKQFVLLDSNGKKIRFLNEVKRQLDLENLEIVQSRVENYHPARGFDTVTSRAFSSLDQMIYWTQHLIADNGIWLAMKGRYPDTELSMIHQNYHVEQYTVAGVEGERCCVIIENTTKE
ncbi:16S rRNA (guanine(527)-N(7))-methyltransferase RsmG [Legionella worsleiensis]|uniref:Ribosomal RNA small subunit methyltransferase G n=1 Tax=Legionella worsleiensis TaxID=45076 RepID=A0A0W1AES9_9GAMM|nr:16S rRNA (guanine(527)-N(7))-methyltransferase RsmG [Legionella worsleiensis]KTD79784.1 glucose inhibited division protein B GidB [Legionella worsleiensis]STY32295.1 glucose inhibited division protein B GidB [Legionella worsleiensis]